MATTVNKIINLAQSWIGKKESNGTHKEIIDIYNSHKPLARNYKVKYTDSWCATFISSLAIKCGATDIIPTECSCEKMIALMKSMGIWIENENRIPNAGDIIFYDWQDKGIGDNKGWSDHVGIVEKVSGSTITVIEGNKNDSVSRREIKINGKYIRGYAVPKYSTQVTFPASNQKPTPTPAENSDKIKVDGQCGTNTTKKAQKVFGTPVDGVISNQLNSYKDICKGILSAEWSDTKKGGSDLVKAMQKWLGIKQDGYIGPKFIKALQTKMGTIVDGVLDNPSMCISAFQTWLNKQ